MCLVLADDQAGRQRGRQTVCERCEVAKAEVEQLMAEVENTAELRAYFVDGGWLTMDPIADAVLSHFERLLAIFERWAEAKGESAMRHFAQSDIPVPGTAVLVMMRELQMHRALANMESQTTETFRL